MNFELIGTMIRLRYKLLWANTRTRNGKIALFFAGYLLLVMVIALLGAGGTGAGMVAIKSGKGAVLAGAMLTGIFAQGLLASVILGFGMANIFSELELRRYPLRAAERRVTRHFIGIADPFWILFLVLDLGIAFGLYLFGAGSFWFGLLAVLLLFVCNYIAARVLGTLVQRLTSQKFGAMMMLVLVICVGMLPALLQPVLKKHPAILEGVKQVWQTTPPAAAGVAMTHLDVSGLQALGVVALWMAALAALLALLERRPPKAAVVHDTKVVVWEGPIDRLGAIFGPKVGPLVAHWLRFYWRNNRFRTIYPLALPLAAFLLFFFSRQDAGHSAMGGPLPLALAVFGIIGFIGTGQFAVNQFGYVGGGFRRFLLLPTDPAAAFRAGSYMFVSLSAALILPAAVLWTLFGTIPPTAALLAMLVGCSVMSLFLFHGIALWTSILGARRGHYKQALGNDLSLTGNVVVLGGTLGWLFLPQLVVRGDSLALVRSFWWVTPLLAVAALIFYTVSLRLTTSLFRARREELMALMEGKG
jgi:ABC-type multidrug transport system fused ATPase/permease subunit